jgi:periplasmic divalent cation tolerance protein
MNKNIIIISTADSQALAEKIADELLKHKLAACANIIAGVQSRYWWQDKINSAEEFILLIKTAEHLFNEVAHTIKQIHTYQCPEIISISIAAGSEDYLNWIKSSIKPGQS